MIQGVLSVEDDSLGTRSKTDSAARKLALELRIIIIPKDQVRKIHHKVRTVKDVAYMWEGSHDEYEDHLEQAYHEISRVIHVPLPAVPKA